jgi:hypothetical protein
MVGWEGRGGEERRGKGEVRRTRKTRGRSRSPAANWYPQVTGAIATCATPDLLLKHPDEIFAT